MRALETAGFGADIMRNETAPFFINLKHDTMKNMKKSTMEIKNDTSYGIVGKRISIDLSGLFAILQMQEKLMKLSQTMDKMEAFKSISALKEEAKIVDQVFMFLDKITEGVSFPSDVYQELTTRPDDLKEI